MNRYKKTKKIAKNGIIEETRSIYFEASPKLNTKVVNPEKKAWENKKQAIKYFSLLINENFNSKDMVLTLSFSSESIKNMKASIDVPAMLNKHDKKAFIRDKLYVLAGNRARCFLRRISRASPMPIKYIFVVSDLNGKTGKETRVHIHLLISGMYFYQKKGVFCFNDKDIKKYWEHGYVYHKYLYADSCNDSSSRQKDGDHIGFCTYLFNQSRILPGKKRVITSYNLHPPKKESEVFLGNYARQIPVPKGCTELSRAFNTLNPGYQSVRYYDPQYDENRQK